jgi:hypothetical protein
LPPVRARVSVSDLLIGLRGRCAGVVVGKEPPGMQIVYERVAGIDVGKKIIAVAVRTPGN